MRSSRCLGGVLFLVLMLAPPNARGGHVNDYCQAYGPCSAGYGDCDSNSECRSGLVCVNDQGGFYSNRGYESYVDVCETPNFDLCKDFGPCPAGNGDCDSDSECQSGLRCSQDVGAIYGYPANYDVCEVRAVTNDLVDYCRDYGPCSVGQGDCDANSECQSGLRCSQDVGAIYGYPANYDVCEVRAVTNDLVDYCRDYGPCSVGQGDCDANSECQSGLQCSQDVGAIYGYPANYDVCEATDPWPNPVDYCRDYGPCSVGQGDCDANSECQSGLQCSQDVGARYGYPANYDVCEARAVTNDLVDYCRDYGPCSAGQGDCDANSECRSGLQCSQDVGARYGFPANYDVCE